MKNSVAPMIFYGTVVCGWLVCLNVLLFQPWGPQQIGGFFGEYAVTAFWTTVGYVLVRWKPALWWAAIVSVMFLVTLVPITLISLVLSNPSCC